MLVWKRSTSTVGEISVSGWFFRLTKVPHLPAQHRCVGMDHIGQHGGIFLPPPVHGFLKRSDRSRQNCIRLMARSFIACRNRFCLGYGNR